MRKVLLFFTFILLCSQLPAQSRIISGKVQDEKGNPVPGASIQIKGSRRGTSTNADGVFSISAPANAKLLMVSSVNFAPQELPISENMTIVLLPAPVSGLQEVVVVAYGTQKRTEVTSAISVVDAKAISNQQVTTVGQALQGTAPGVMVVNDNGQPGENPTIRIRGIASIAASAAPLIVLDGIPFDGNLNMINPNDIDNFSVLKDASATALYGSRAANGVILINTKAGKRNAAPSITLSALYGRSSRATKDYSYLNTKQQFELTFQPYMEYWGMTPQQASDYLTSPYGFGYNPFGPSIPNPVGTDGKLTAEAASAKLLWNDDWTKALTRSSPARRDVNLGISGGTDRSRYYFSGGYLDQDGYITKSQYRRITARLNYTSDLTDWLQIGARSSIITSHQNYPDQGTGHYSDVVAFGRTMSSVFPIYERDDSGRVVRDLKGNPVYDYGYYDPNKNANTGRPVLPLANVVGTTALDSWTYDRLLTDLNVYAQVNFTKGIYFKTSFGINRNNVDQLQYQNKDFGDAASVSGRTYKQQDLTTSWTFNNMMGYDQRFGDHHIEAIASYEAYKYNFETLYGSKTGFGFSGAQQPIGGAVAESFDGYTVANTLVSLLGRARYDYQGKYFAELSVRRDGSSNFAPGNRYGVFPAGGVSWLISKESFLNGNATVGLLKLRASYGAVGNNALLDGSGFRTYFPYLSTFAYGYNDLTNPGVYLNQLANPQIQWEKQLSANIGIDFELFKSRFTGSLDLFTKNSQHLILNQPLSPSVGFGSFISNIGKVRNQGIELNLNYAILRSKSFSWDVNLNITYLRNKIITLLPGIDTFAVTGAFRNVVGKSIYEYYLPLWAGVDPADGHGLWWTDERDASGNLTGKQVKTNNYSLAQTTGKWVGSGIPKYTGGFSTRLKYGNIDMSILFNYALGGKYYDNNYASLMHGTFAGFGAQMSIDETKAWQKAGDITDVPKMNASANDEEQLSTRFLYNGDYLRLRNVTLGYTIRMDKWQKVVKDARIYVQADNILTFDGLKQGSDPESSLNGFASGNAFPFKTLSAGINLTF
jgi:TonB-linked SusC/RagA family outer membrane protein